MMNNWIVTESEGDPMLVIECAALHARITRRNPRLPYTAVTTTPVGEVSAVFDSMPEAIDWCEATYNRHAIETRERSLRMAAWHTAEALDLVGTPDDDDTEGTYSHLTTALGLLVIRLYEGNWGMTGYTLRPLRITGTDGNTYGTWVDWLKAGGLHADPEAE